MSDIVPAKKESWITQWARSATSKVQKAEPKSGLSYVRSAGGVASDYFQGGALGALLGATHAKFGLDAMGFPLDGAIAGLSAIATIAFSGVRPEWASWASRRGEVAFGVFTFRKSFELVSGGPMRASFTGPGAVTRLSAGSVNSAKIDGKSAIEQAAARM